MGCCLCELGACFCPIVDFFQDLYSTYLKPIVENPILQFFITYIYPVIEFFLPITIFSAVLLVILRPSNVVPRVDAAVATSFSLDHAASTLGYDIAVDLGFHNRRYLDAKYLDLTAVASYAGTRLGPTVDVLPVFVQRANATNVVHAVFQGAGVRLNTTAAAAYEEEAADGEFNVLVTVSSTFMYDVLIEKVVYYYDHQCYIRFPPPRAGGAATTLTLGTLCNAIAR